MWVSASTLFSVRRILGIILAVVLLGGVAAAVVAGGETEKEGKDGEGTATTTVRGVIGSEKAEFFADPEVAKTLAAHGLIVKAEKSGSWAMNERPLRGYDFAFPGSTAPARELARKAGVKGELPRPFYSPLVVAAHRDAARVLADNGLAVLDGKNSGTLKMGAYLKAAESDRTWQELKGGDAHSQLTGTVFVTSTDPVASNSGALYLAAASYAADGGRVAADDADIDRTAGLMRKLIGVQGAQQTSSDAPFRDFVSGAGNPLVLVYEAQVASLLIQRQDVGDLVVLYPDTTVNSDHTLVPLTTEGRKLGRLLSGDEKLRELAVRHGFRPQGATAEFAAATEPHAGHLNQDLNGVRQAPVPTAEVLRKIAQRAKSQ
ncbi:hypothetical protein LHJ74_23340 [Streptomyces sp. N2-109]|uniref:Solute-binding protein n=1 Tax=Streptomyces gossypii TaxID=2883101 RepID=A0ABT2JYN7_9ACTN|nr:hypothetical protein [Streptomyces gossypii]MCT2592811.1 hypothetical protein [Streptomyces gossypii]